MSTKRLVLLPALLATILAAGCASTPAGPGGKYLVYRDKAGTAVWQFDYPSDDFCKRVERAAGGSGPTARCEPDPVAAGQLTAKATLRYNPPGVLVEGHYPDVAKCQRDTAVPAAGVQVINPCTAK